MLTPILAIVCGFLVAFGLRFANLLSTAGVVAPGVLTALVVLFLLLRRSSRRVEPLVKEAEKHIAGGRVELAIKTIEGGMSLGRWNPLVPAQLRALVGSLYFDLGKHELAEPALARALRWPWTTKALLGVIYFRRRDEKRMKKAFEKAVSAGAKEPLAWTLYAYCMTARGSTEAAVKILERGLKKNPRDGRLQTNLELAREGKKLKTAPYGDKWSRFGLDGDGPTVPKAARGFALRPGFRQRPRRR